MSREDYYHLLEKKHEQTDWKDMQRIKAYNAYARQHRKQLNEED